MSDTILNPHEKCERSMSHAIVHVISECHKAEYDIIIMIIEQSKAWKFALQKRSCDHFITMIMVVVHVSSSFNKKTPKLCFENCLCSQDFLLKCIGKMREIMINPPIK